MHKPNITSGTVLVKLVSILNEDITQLDRMMHNRSAGSNSYILIESMKEAKLDILSTIPNNSSGTSEVPTTGQLYPIKGYNSNEDFNDPQDESILTKMFQKVEEGQYEYVKYALRADGLPKDIVKVLEKILNKYTNIIRQLERAKSTNQTNKIII